MTNKDRSVISLHFGTRFFGDYSNLVDLDIRDGACREGPKNPAFHALCSGVIPYNVGVILC